MSEIDKADREERTTLCLEMPEGATREDAEKLAEGLRVLAEVLHKMVSPESDPPVVAVRERREEEG